MNRGLDKQPKSEKPTPQVALLNKRIVITRARSQAGELARRIQDLGGEVIDCPTIEIQPPESYDRLDAAIRAVRDYHWLILTSVNGVEQFLMRFQRVKGSLSDLEPIQIAAIGPETAKRLEQAGLKPALVPDQYIAEGILRLLSADTIRGKKVLVPRAAKARDVLPETLRDWGARVDVVETYRTVVPNTDAAPLRSLLLEQKVDMITFTSSSTVTNFAKLFRVESLAKLLSATAIACIGPITQKTVEELGGRVAVVAEEFTIPGLVRAIVKHFDSSRGIS